MVFDGKDVIQTVKLKDAAKFMLVNRARQRAFLSQFFLIKTFCFYQSHKLDHVYNRVSTCKVDNWLVVLLIRHGKFKPKTIILNQISLFQHGKNITLPEVLNPMECFSYRLDSTVSVATLKLVSSLITESGLDMRNYQGPELLLDYLQIVDGGNCLAMLDKILALNAKVIVVNAPMENYNKLPNVASFSSVNVLRVERLKLNYYCVWNAKRRPGLFDFPVNKWLQLLCYVLRSCPNLKKLDVHIFVPEKAGNYCPQLPCLLQAVKGIRDVVLPLLLLLKDDCFFQFTLSAGKILWSKKGACLANEELLAIGVSTLPEDDKRISRVLKIGDRANLSLKMNCYLFDRMR
uniref:FBD domain-containing protein n=1 Tax=Ditylenchus dipsaci TaxID=166011 RepID=A0A915DP42_9BILA